MTDLMPQPIGLTGQDHDERARSGDGFVELPDGALRWGLSGAAGLLLQRRAEDGTVHYLLQRRSLDVHMGGTWSVPGGALREGEDPADGAVREFKEEVGEFPERAVVVRTYTAEEQGWSYTTIVMEVRDDHLRARGDSREAQGLRWVTVEEMQDLLLHPGFSASLPHLIERAKVTWETGEIGDRLLPPLQPDPLTPWRALGAEPQTRDGRRWMIVSDPAMTSTFLRRFPSWFDLPIQERPPFLWNMFCERRDLWDAEPELVAAAIQNAYMLDPDLLSPAWVAMFKSVGFISDGTRLPSEPIIVYRGCSPEGVQFLSWTPSLGVAAWYAEYRALGAVYEAVVMPEDILAMWMIGGTLEVVVDPTCPAVRNARPVALPATEIRAAAIKWMESVGYIDRAGDEPFCTACGKRFTSDGHFLDHWPCWGSSPDPRAWAGEVATRRAIFQSRLGVA